jgi:hypothetical protein
MLINYNSDANYFTRKLVQGIFEQGYTERAADVALVLQQMESELPSFVAAAQQLMDDGNFREAIRIFFSDNKGRMNQTGKELLSQISFPSGKDFARSKVIEAASAADSAAYKVKTPLNALAGMAVLFDIMVMPQRHFNKANTILDSLCSVKLEIVNDDGESILTKREADAFASQEYLFWQLLDRLLDEFELRDIVPPNDAASQKRLPTSTTRPAAVGLSAQLIAGRFIEMLEGERQ